jgi:hypothetical protein
VTKSSTGRNVLFVLLGVVGLVLKPHYSGPLADIVHSYLGNLSMSFAVYFLFLQPAGRFGVGKLPAAVAALAVVESFEAFDGFGVMTNVYDTIDFIANAAGIGLAWAIDVISGRYSMRRKARSAASGGDTPAA